MNIKATSIGILALVVIGGAVFFASSNDHARHGAPIQSHRSYEIRSSSREYISNSPVSYSFSIVDELGNTLKEFAITHTEPMHVLIVRKDLEHFQHLHPEFDGSTGTFTIEDFMFPEDGEYRIFADFAAATGQKDPLGNPLQIVLYEDVKVGTAYNPQDIGSESRMKKFGPYDVSLATLAPPLSGTDMTLVYEIRENGKIVTDLEEYLGALGHAVILREKTLDFTHVHPLDDLSDAQAGKVAFAAHFPHPGKYKAFTQFKRNGIVFTTDFVISVNDGAEHDGANDHTSH